MKRLRRSLEKGNMLVADGAWGTMLFKKGLKYGDCPELWNITHRNEVLDVAKQYINAGSQIIGTNSFGGNSIRLSEFGLEKRAQELNKAAAEISREVVGDENVFILGSVGPTGKFLSEGIVSEQEIFDSFSEQI